METNNISHVIDNKYQVISQMNDMLNFRSEAIMQQLKYAKDHDDEYFLAKFKSLLEFRKRIAKIEEEVIALEVQEIEELSK